MSEVDDSSISYQRSRNFFAGLQSEKTIQKQQSQPMADGQTVDKQTSHDQTVDKQTSHDQTVDKQTSHDQTVDKQNSHTQTVDTQEQTRRVSTSSTHSSESGITADDNKQMGIVLWGPDDITKHTSTEKIQFTRNAEWTGIIKNDIAYGQAYAGIIEVEDSCGKFRVIPTAGSGKMTCYREDKWDFGLTFKPNNIVGNFIYCIVQSGNPPPPPAKQCRIYSMVFNRQHQLTVLESKQDQSTHGTDDTDLCVYFTEDATLPDGVLCTPSTDGTHYNMTVTFNSKQYVLYMKKSEDSSMGEIRAFDSTMDPKYKPNAAKFCLGNFAP